MISAIVPGRNEQEVIAACVHALARQPEIAQIFVVDDQSTDKTAETVKRLMPAIPQLRLLRTQEVPAGWVGKNYAVSIGAKQATQFWLLFTDADGELLPGATARAMQIAQENAAALVSFSPEQMVDTWYEKALIPFVYTRLAKLFSYSEINNPSSSAAAANGQFLMIRRDTYEAIGGHASVAGEVLEDVALAKRVKAAGYRIWFGSGAGLGRVRMYRSFAAMWEGWRKNLYLLVGGTPAAVYREMFSVVPWIPFLLIALAIRFPLALMLGLGLLLARHAAYGMALSSNRFPVKYILYCVPGVLLYAGVLWASYRAHIRGIVEWKGREVSVRAAE
jgi:glycosyltransferase involved in cell wall biosynthesis